ncbi:hypothetical protein NECAME_10721 [Necator americanus]|uniref:Protein kinase domain-containing protein n=1 Tax=Necator americanus TaxID=51031 RepID=W2T7B6_NECAM|nr:hypothetical protein NECAME_10721 [Necator americanus]ETN77905.1 hypothetical protein NECAME_10721 [Necator americanus]
MYHSTNTFQKEKAQEKTEEEMEEEKKQRDENELRHIHIKYSRRAKLYYVRLYGFKWVSGLIEYHRRYRIPLDEDGTIIRKAVKRAEWQLNHEQIIIHRDVAARNCLIGKNDVAKISDFGLSIVGTQKKEKTLKKVPVRYLAPETLKKREYTVKTDVWSFGVFMWEVFHDGKEPYAEMNAKEVRKYVLSGNTLDNESDHYPQHMWSITVSCFAHDPQSRPRFDSIAAQIWTGIDEFKEHDKMLSMIKFW